MMILSLNSMYHKSLSHYLVLDSCDNLENDGDAIFDLTQQTPNIIAQLTPSSYTIEYFETQEDAENNTNPIISADEYDNIVLFLKLYMLELLKTPTQTAIQYQVFN